MSEKGFLGWFKNLFKPNDAYTADKLLEYNAERNLNTGDVVRRANEIVQGLPNDPNSLASEVTFEAKYLREADQSSSEKAAFRLAAGYLAYRRGHINGKKMRSATVEAYQELFPEQ